MALGPDIGTALGQTLFGSGASGLVDSSRIPMSFTSTKRLRLINSQFQGFGREREAAAGEAAAVLFDRKNQLAFSSNILPVIQMSINPKSIGWRQPKRIVKRDYQEGSVFYHFTNSKGQNNDILTLDFRHSE